MTTHIATADTLSREAKTTLNYADFFQSDPALETFGFDETEPAIAVQDVLNMADPVQADALERVVDALHAKQFWATACRLFPSILENPERVRHMLEMRYGFDGNGERTQEELGESSGVSRGRAGQIVGQAERRLFNDPEIQGFASEMSGYTDSEDGLGPQYQPRTRMELARAAAARYGDKAVFAIQDRQRVDAAIAEATRAMQEAAQQFDELEITIYRDMKAATDDQWIRLAQLEVLFDSLRVERAALVVAKVRLQSRR